MRIWFISEVISKSKEYDGFVWWTKALGNTNQIFNNKRKKKSAHQNNENAKSDVCLTKESNNLPVLMISKNHWLLKLKHTKNLQGDTMGKRNEVWHSLSNYGVSGGRTSVAGPIKYWQKECENCSQGERRQGEQSS